MAVDLLDAETDNDVTGAPERRPRARWILVALVIAVLAATFGYLAGNEVQANTQFDQTHRSLDTTRGHIHSVLSELASVRRQLGTVDGQVKADGAALAQDTSQLQGVKKALTDAQAHVTQQASTIGNLQTCLGGVEQALNALAVADQNHAIDALDAVSTSCAQAVASNG